MVGVILQLHRQLRVDQVVLEVEQLDVLLFQVVLVTLVVLIHPKVMQVVKELMFLLIIMILVDQVVELEVQEHQIIQEQVVQVSWSQDHLSLVLHFQQVLDVIQFH